MIIFSRVLLSCFLISLFIPSVSFGKTKSDIQWEFLQDVASLIDYANQLNIKLTGGELYRTIDQQTLHLKNKKSLTENSLHLERLAIDFNFFTDSQVYTVDLLGEYWEALDPKNKWGGNFNNFYDPNHFERHY